MRIIIKTTYHFINSYKMYVTNTTNIRVCKLFTFNSDNCCRVNGAVNRNLKLNSILFLFFSELKNVLFVCLFTFYSLGVLTWWLIQGTYPIGMILIEGRGVRVNVNKCYIKNHNACLISGVEFWGIQFLIPPKKGKQ